MAGSKIRAMQTEGVDRGKLQVNVTGRQEAQTDSKCPDPVVLYSRPGDGVRGIRYK